MKAIKYITLLLVGAFAVSCAWDNYDKPESQLTGRIVYQGEPLGFSISEVNFQLFEPGWQLVAPINVNVAADGSYSALLFDGKYKLVIPQNRGPFMNIPNNGSDTIIVDLKGKTVKDIEVMPYYMIRNPQISASARVVTASFKAEKIINDANAKNIERVNLYVNKTMLVDNRSDYHIVKAELGGNAIADPNSITLSVTVPELTIVQNYAFARVGIKIAGVEKMIFSPVQKINL
jgi:hypothetical protein